MSEQLLTDLNRAKALFQQRAILAAMGVKPEQVGIKLWGIGLTMSKTSDE